ncbi:hypothetical protein CAEBREN_32188 [Caenorhabditis brenneri]|uniref:RNA 3'-terminal phosphate cyclase domain-containing protein n=1 Tax=Caenorhabditis brenneri TaxID=135651 RepID=G0PMP6_CAEBE|nr:hypothetical protein CAEBREN_32188 [Caenorhabditis brenneri]
MSSETLEFSGCNFFRLRLAYSILSGRPIRIVSIRKNDDRPGIRDFEAKLIGMLEKVTNGTKVEISRTGTQVNFRPGMITGGVVTVDCGAERCISYFLEPLILLSPFCKLAMTIKLKGVTNSPDEISVDGIKASWLKVYNKFVLNDEKLDIQIQCRGLKPEGGAKFTGWALDSSAQVLASTFMTLCPKDVSHFLYGPLPMYSVHCLRHLKQFFEIEFKMEEYQKIQKNEDADLRTGSSDKAMITAVGVGYSNLNKTIL